jgi:ABC-type polysaccharide/polyol phosphate export permease
VAVISNLVSQLVSLALLLAIIVVFGHPVHAALPLVLVYLFFAVVICVGIGWILSSLTVFLRDIPQVIGLVLTGLFFFTPICYAPSIVPAKILFIMKLNPLYHVIDGYRLACLAGKVLPLSGFAYLGLSSVVIAAVGGILFRKLKPEFAEVM